MKVEGGWMEFRIKGETEGWNGEGGRGVDDEGMEGRDG